MTDDPSIAFVNAMADGVRIRAKAGDVLFRPGEACRGFIAIRSGCVRVSLTAASGRRSFFIPCTAWANLPADLFVPSGAANPTQPKELPNRIWMRSSRCWPFQRLLDEDGAFRAALLRSAADRFSDFEQVVQTLAFTGLAQRTAGALLRLCDAQGEVSATHEAVPPRGFWLRPRSGQPPIGRLRQRGACAARARENQPVAPRRLGAHGARFLPSVTDGQVVAPDGFIRQPHRRQGDRT